MARASGGYVRPAPLQKTPDGWGARYSFATGTIDLPKSNLWHDVERDRVREPCADPAAVDACGTSQTDIRRAARGRPFAHETSATA
jgi:hypothetical protein